jgi:hypothetical protein
MQAYRDGGDREVTLVRRPSTFRARLRANLLALRRLSYWFLALPLVVGAAFGLLGAVGGVEVAFTMGGGVAAAIYVLMLFTTLSVTVFRSFVRTLPEANMPLSVRFTAERLFVESSPGKVDACDWSFIRRAKISGDGLTLFFCEEPISMWLVEPPAVPPHQIALLRDWLTAQGVARDA